VAPEDIPAKTQLFTPNWIVQFLTQNSLGRLWMDVYPDSPLRQRMPYYTPPAEQEPGVAARLREVTPKSLDPNTLTAIDPAAGSGHILLELYNLFFAMYQEQGYMPQEIPRRILEQNLFGLELDRRAAQIAGFAVLMRARADDPRLLNDPPNVNVRAIRHSRDLDLAPLLTPRQAEDVFPSERLFEGEQPRLATGGRALFSDAGMVRAMKELFDEADIVGSLQRIPQAITAKLDAFAAEVAQVRQSANLMENESLAFLADLVSQSQVLARHYTACVANPPYLGGKAMVKELKDFAKEEYPDTKADLFAMFIERGFDLAEPHGFVSMVTMQSWMFLSGYEEFRKGIVENKAICSMVHMGNGVMGIAFGTAATSIRNSRLPRQVGSYCHAEMADLDQSNRPKQFPVAGPRCTSIAQDELKKIPGWPIAYWLSESARAAFLSFNSLGELAEPRLGMATGDNGLFVRAWFEVDAMRIGLNIVSREGALRSGRKWFPYNKGGEFRQWYGNNLWVVNWQDDGRELQSRLHPSGRVWAHNFNLEYVFRPSITWTFVTSGSFAARYCPQGFLFDVAGSSMFPPKARIGSTLAFLTSSSAFYLLKGLNPTLNFQAGNLASLPAPTFGSKQAEVEELANDSIDIFKRDWDEYETSWDFTGLTPFLSSAGSVEQWWYARANQCELLLGEARLVLREINSVVADSLSLAQDVATTLKEEEITLWANPRHVFRPKRKKGTETEDVEPDNAEVVTAETIDAKTLEAKFREKGLKELLSYALGCMMGRYSLDEPGLIYARAGGEGFDTHRYHSFPADEDGILPLNDQPFFGEQDTAARFAKWVDTVWPNSRLEENLAFIADNLGRKTDDTPLEAIRRYVLEDFYEDHLRTYKSRPIYWLFTSGKKRAFQALVYLHRYHPGTLGRMRSHYVQPLIGKLRAQLDQAESAAYDLSLSASEKSKRTKASKKLRDQYDELLAFDERLHHYALQGIALDLDDGVKANYGKFSDPKVGDILAKVKDITGGKDD